MGLHDYSLANLGPLRTDMDDDNALAEARVRRALGDGADEVLSMLGIGGAA